MTWQLYRWVWQLCSPLHVGTSPAGALNRTRLYIPARAMWGALTAELARRKAGVGFPDYETIGQELQEKARFTYLYPSEQVKSNWYAWLPRYENGKGLLWYREDNRPEPLSDRKFRKRLLFTLPGTAIDPASDTAEENTLREMECIQPRWCTDGGKDGGKVAFVGYILLQNGALSKAVWEINELFVGADIRYGLGRLRRIQWEQTERCFGRRVNLGSRNPQVETCCLLAHALATEKSFKGALEVLQQWDIEQPRVIGLTWVPGSRVQDDVGRFEILPSGLWGKRGIEGSYGKGVRGLNKLMGEEWRHG